MSARRVDFDSSVAIVIWGAGSGVRSQPPPATMVQMLARAVRDMNPLCDQLSPCFSRTTLVYTTPAVRGCTFMTMWTDRPPLGCHPLHGRLPPKYTEQMTIYV